LFGLDVVRCASCFDQTLAALMLEVGGTMSKQVWHEKLDAIFDARLQAELAGDLDETLATMSPDPHLVNVPTEVDGFYWTD
jgi:hypothetical protein